MTGSMTWLKNASISGGSNIDLWAITTTYNFNNFVSTNPVPGKDVTLSHGSRLTEVEYLGHDNPKIIVEGRFDKTKSVNASGSVSISIPNLASFCTIGSPSWFFDEDTAGTSPAGSLCVFPQGFKFIKSITNENAKWINYSLELVETQEW